MDIPKVGLGGGGRENDNGGEFANLKKLPPPDANEIQWVLENFESLADSEMYSPVHVVGDFAFRIKLYPKGIPQQNTTLSIFCEVVTPPHKRGDAERGTTKDKGGDSVIEDEIDSGAIDEPESGQLAKQDDPNKTWFYHSTKFHVAIIDYKDWHNSKWFNDTFTFNESEKDRGWRNVIQTYEIQERFLSKDGALCVRCGMYPKAREGHWPFTNKTKAECGYVGLMNHGATCYMNCLLQSLYHVGSFRQSIYEMTFEHDERWCNEQSEKRKLKQHALSSRADGQDGGLDDLEENDDKIYYTNEDGHGEGKLSHIKGWPETVRNAQGEEIIPSATTSRTDTTSSTFGTDALSSPVGIALQTLFLRLSTENEPVSCQQLLRSFGWETRDNFTQHDTQELNRLLCEKLEACMKGTKADGTIKRLFEGKTENYVDFSRGGVPDSSKREEVFLDLQVDVQGIPNLHASLREYVKKEKLEGDNQYDAEGYGKVDAEKGIRFISFPPVLQFHLKRFQFDFNRMDRVKINDKFGFPHELDLEPLAEGAGEYELMSVTVHSGDVHSGHYTVFIRNDSERRKEFQEQSDWLKFDDEKVMACDQTSAIDDNFGGAHETDANYFIASKHGERDLNQEDNSMKETKKNHVKLYSAYILCYVQKKLKTQLIKEPKLAEVNPYLQRRAEFEKRRKLLREDMQQMIKAHIKVKIISERSLRGCQGHWRHPKDIPADLLVFRRRDTSLVELYKELVDSWIRSGSLADLVHVVERQCAPHPPRKRRQRDPTAGSNEHVTLQQDAVMMAAPNDVATQSSTFGDGQSAMSIDAVNGQSTAKPKARRSENTKTDSAVAGRSDDREQSGSEGGVAENRSNASTDSKEDLSDVVLAMWILDMGAPQEPQGVNLWPNPLFFTNASDNPKLNRANTEDKYFHKSLESHFESNVAKSQSNDPTLYLFVHPIRRPHDLFVNGFYQERIKAGVKPVKDELQDALRPREPLPVASRLLVPSDCLNMLAIQSIIHATKGRFLKIFWTTPLSEGKGRESSRALAKKGRHPAHALSLESDGSFAVGPIREPHLVAVGFRACKDPKANVNSVDIEHQILNKLTIMHDENHPSVMGFPTEAIDGSDVGSVHRKGRHVNTGARVDTDHDLSVTDNASMPRDDSTRVVLSDDEHTNSNDSVGDDRDERQEVDFAIQASGCGSEVSVVRPIRKALTASCLTEEKLYNCSLHIETLPDDQLAFSDTITADNYQPIVLSWGVGPAAPCGPNKEDIPSVTPPSPAATPTSPKPETDDVTMAGSTPSTNGEARLINGAEAVKDEGEVKQQGGSPAFVGGTGRGVAPPSFTDYVLGLSPPPMPTGMLPCESDGMLADGQTATRSTKTGSGDASSDNRQLNAKEWIHRQQKKFVAVAHLWDVLGMLNTPEDVTGCPMGMTMISNKPTDATSNDPESGRATVSSSRSTSRSPSAADTLPSVPIEPNVNRQAVEGEQGAGDDVTMGDRSYFKPTMSVKVHIDGAAPFETVMEQIAMVFNVDPTRLWLLPRAPLNVCLQRNLLAMQNHNTKSTNSFWQHFLDVPLMMTDEFQSFAVGLEPTPQMNVIRGLREGGFKRVTPDKASLKDCLPVPPASKTEESKDIPKPSQSVESALYSGVAYQSPPFNDKLREGFHFVILPRHWRSMEPSTETPLGGSRTSASEDDSSVVLHVPMVVHVFNSGHQSTGCVMIDADYSFKTGLISDDEVVTKAKAQFSSQMIRLGASLDKPYRLMVQTDKGISPWFSGPWINKFAAFKDSKKEFTFTPKVNVFSNELVVLMKVCEDPCLQELSQSRIIAFQNVATQGKGTGGDQDVGLVKLLREKVVVVSVYPRSPGPEYKQAIANLQRSTTCCLTGSPWDPLAVPCGVGHPFQLTCEPTTTWNQLKEKINSVVQSYQTNPIPIADIMMPATDLINAMFYSQPPPVNLNYPDPTKAPQLGPPADGTSLLSLAAAQRDIYVEGFRLSPHLSFGIISNEVGKLKVPCHLALNVVVEHPAFGFQALMPSTSAPHAGRGGSSPSIN
eukprot:GHVN01001279.1.p1 GENE.GHVN01001279.1~~GHVN01001279.1.p1  ORF type:complete len:2032 (-),score=277.06 GHVN01001279.1:3553-9648(-)